MEGKVEEASAKKIADIEQKRCSESAPPFLYGRRRPRHL